MGLKLTVKQIVAELIATLDGRLGGFPTWGRIFKRGQGTVASVLATPLWLSLGWGQSSWELYLVILIAVVLVGVWATKVYEPLVGGEDLPEVVIDEVVGMGIALFLVPMSLGYVALALGLFRLFDIWKPMGVRYFDQNHFHGWGVMLDDVVAGIYALILVQGLAHSRWGDLLL